MVKLSQIRRDCKGASLVLMAALLVVLVGIIVAALQLVGLFSGGRQLQNATDSGNLNVARSAATKIGVALQAGNEQDNFGAFQNANGQVDLVQYNRVVGQCVWVALNAQAEGTNAAKTNSQSVIAAAQGNNNSIGSRLQSALSDTSQTDPFFNKLASNNPMGMMGNSPVTPNDNKSTVGYMNPNGLTNVTFDPSNAPFNAAGSQVQLPANLLSSTKGASGQPFISGYNGVSFGNIGTLSGVSVQPSQAPHLVANSDFDSHTSQPVSNLTLPPNSFQSVAATAAEHIKGAVSGANVNPNAPIGEGIAKPTFVSMTSSAIVGLLNQQNAAAIPHGFIKIVNGSGDADNSPLPSNESIFNNQLFTGIFVANNGVFSTDESQIQAWADYNNNGQSGQAPPTDGMFNVAGSPVSTEQTKITSLGGNGYPAMCDYTNVQGANANPAAAALLPAFEIAYPAPLAGGGTGAILTAVEKLKAEVMELYTAGAGGTPAPVTTTGMRYFNHTATYVAGAGQSPEFTRPGNVVELANQSAQLANTTGVNNNNQIISFLKQRMKEIKPTATDAEMNELLTGNTLDLGTTFYVWLDNTNTFRMTQTAPQWGNQVANTNVTPDGSASPLGVAFPTIGLSVDPTGECGFNQSLFAVQPDPATDYLGVDTATWTPSSGTSNLLGTLQFSESISGTAVVVTTKTPPPPPSCNGPWITAVQDYMANAEFYDPGYIANIYSLGQGHVSSVTQTGQDWGNRSNGCVVSQALANADGGNNLYAGYAGQYVGAVLTTTVTFDDSTSCGANHTFQVPN